MVTDGNTKEIGQMLYTRAKDLNYVFYDALGQLANWRCCIYEELRQPPLGAA